MEMVGKVQTVLGPQPPQSLGRVLTHEHVFVQFLIWSCPPRTVVEEEFWNRPVEMPLLGKLRRRTWSNYDNLRLDDFDTAVSELELYRMAGGGTIVEVTPPALGRDARALERLSRRTGVNIVCGTSFYVADAHPPFVANASVEDLAASMQRELTEGIDNSNVRAGMIGEIGTSDPIHEDEKKVLRAAALAQRRTGAPIEVHMAESDTLGLEVLDVLEEAGADLSHAIICHVDGREPDLDYYRAILRRGSLIEFDFFGVTWTNDDIRERENGDRPLPTPPSDDARVAAIATLAAEGFLDRILVSHDTATKIQLVTYGGYGYAHLLENMVPLLKMRGLAQADIDTLFLGNPQRVLTWKEPAE